MMNNSESRKRPYEVITIEDSDSDEEVIQNDDIEEYDAVNEEEIENFSSKSLSIVQKLRNNAKFVQYEEWKDYKSAYANVLRRIEENPIIKENVKFEVPERQNFEITKMQAIRLHQSFNGDPVFNHETKNNQKIKMNQKEPNAETKFLIECAFDDLQSSSRYQPPSTRVRLMKNLTFAADYTVPVYCDRETTDIKSIDIPETMNFVYTDRNTMTKSVKAELDKLIKLTENNLIKCVCGKNGKEMVKCYENPDCKCYKINKQLAKLQHLNVYRKSPTEFKTFGRILMRDIDHYFDTFAFSCSSSCKCEGCCDNNVLYRIENNLNRFEVYRHDEKGFCVRTRNFIPHGTPVFEFTGELFTEEHVQKRGSMDYSYRISDSDSFCETFIEYLKKTKYLNRSLKKELMNVFKKTWCIDPKKKGNESRFVSHGCTPNLTMVRVFQGGFGPQQTRLVMTSLEDIFPGTQLTVDYGDEYIRKILGNKCLCNTAGCENNKKAKLISQATYGDMVHFLCRRFNYLAKDYNRYIIKGHNPPQKSPERQVWWRRTPPKKSRSSMENESRLSGYRKCMMRGDTPFSPYEEDYDTPKFHINEYAP